MIFDTSIRQKYAIKFIDVDYIKSNEETCEFRSRICCLYEGFRVKI